MKQYFKFLFTKRLGTAIIILFMLMLITVGGPHFDSEGAHWSQPLKEIADPFSLTIILGLIIGTIFALLSHVYDEFKKK
jgi:hypothetical protein